MPKTLQFRRDNTAGLSTVTGSVGELFVDTSKKVVVVMDGSTSGGQPLQKELTSSVDATVRNLTVTNVVGTAATFSGNVTVGGVLTYEDVTNIDAVGLVTARTGVRITSGGLVVTAGISTFGAAINYGGVTLSNSVTGTGSMVLSSSPSLTTPTLGTPTSGTLTNCTGYTVGNLSGLAANVATFLATPSSSNLAAALTDETGTGANVFATSPTLVTPNLGTPTSGTLTNCTGYSATNLTSGTIPGDRGVTSGSTSSSFVEYNGITKTAGQFDGGTTNPDSTTRLNYDGYLYATRFYGDGSQLTGISGGGDLTSVTSDILPSVDGVYDLGSSAKSWYDLFVSNGITFDGTSSISLNLNTTGATPYLNLNGDLSLQDLTSTSALIGDVLISTNIITPDKGGYMDGELIIDGDLDIKGDYVTLPRAINHFVDGAWSATANFNTGRRNHASFGTYDANVICGGKTGAFTETNTTENYNGTSWSSGGNMIDSPYWHTATGTSTAGLRVGGRDVNNTFKTTVQHYDGTSWSSGTALSSAKNQLASAGTQTAAVIFGGLDASTTYLNTTEKYNGSSWSSSGNLLTGRSGLSGGGTQTQAFAFGGFNAPNRLSSTEVFNGTTWSSGPNMSIVKDYGMGGSASNSSEPGALSAGGVSTGGNRVATTEELHYLENVWITGQNLPETKSDAGMSGSKTGYLLTGGDKTSGGSILDTSYLLSPSTTVDTAGGAGDLRFNSYTSKVQVYDGTAWVDLH